MSSSLQAPKSVGPEPTSKVWRSVRLGDLGHWFGGGTPSKANPRFWDGGDIPWVSPKDMKTVRISDAQDHITREAVEKSTTSLVSAGSILIVVRSGILKHTLPVAVTEREVALNQDLKAVTPSDEVSSDFLAMALKAFEQEILQTCCKSGTTVQNIEMPAFLRFKIPLPPLDEQREIVAEIEKQFTRLEAGVGALKRVQENLKRYRASILKKLVGANGSPLYALVDLVDPGAKVLYGILQPGPEIPGGVPYVRPTEINVDTIQIGEIRRTSPEIASKYSRSILKGGDIILSIVGTIGKVAIVPLELEGGNITQSSVRIRPDSQKILVDYLAWVLRSPFATQQYDAVRLGTAVPRLNVAHVRELKIPVPSLSEQKRIVEEVEHRLSIVKKLEATVSTNLHRATRLRQSILKKAFAK